MKSTTNVFLEGLRTDLHPLSTGQQYLTDVLNATMITYNGNEMMLQNDMGNTLILDSATGNIMGLSPGFIPIGMKEHGGIMYIASVNKDGEGEIGTIPSPIIRDIYNSHSELIFNKMPIPIGYSGQCLISNKFYPKDKFMLSLDLSMQTTDIKGGDVEGNQPSEIIISRIVADYTSKEIIKDITTPLISYNKLDNSITFSKGIYKLALLSINETGSIIAPASLLTANSNSNYWFYDSHDDFPKDLFEASFNSDLKTFDSNNKPGYLAIRLEPETCGDLELLERKNYPHDVPYTWKKQTKNYETYYCYIPGFHYTTDSGIYVQSLKNIKIVEEGTNNTVDCALISEPTTWYNEIPIINFAKFNLDNDTVKPQDSDDNVNNVFYNLELLLIKYDTKEGYFQQLVGKSFVLSPFQTKSTTTNFESSTGLDPTVAHSGLICCNLGEDITNKWYRMDLDYYDLYDNKLGHFTKRFNPYLNDTFGTNLSVTSVELKPKQNMGTTIYPSYKWEGSSELCPISYFRSIARTFTVGGTPTFEGNNYLLLNGPNSFTPEGSLTKNITIKRPDTTTFAKSLIQSDYFPYLYDTSFQVTLDREIQTVSGKFYSLIAPDHTISTDDGLGIKISSRILSNVDLDNKVNKWERTTGETIEQLTSNFSFDPESEYYDYPIYLTYEYDGDWKDSYGYLPRKVALNDRRENTLLEWTLPSLAKIDSSESIETELSVLPLNLQTKCTFDDNLSITFGQLYIDGKEVEADKVLYAIAGAPNPNLNLEFQFECLVVNTLRVQSIEPSYSICPYFLLKGTSEEKDHYVYRLRDNQEELVYSCNLELDNGIPKSYITVNDNYILEKTPFSYTTFKYTTGDCQSTSVNLEPGIYVLNILHCPSLTNWISNGNAEHVKMIFKFNDEEVQVLDYWRTSSNTLLLINSEGGPLSLDTNIGDEGLLHLYIPIVFVLTKATSVELSITSDDTTNYPFPRQSVGLYKLKDILDEDIQTVVKNERIKPANPLLLHNYMSAILKQAELDFADNTVQKYAFILKYGVFFREAYVFIEGVYSNGCVNSIQITPSDDTNYIYKALPFIPKEPYVLPMGMKIGDDFSVSYVWNAYFMLDNILSEEVGTFGFSNNRPISGEILSTSTRPSDKGLRGLRIENSD